MNRHPTAELKKEIDEDKIYNDIRLSSSLTNVAGYLFSKNIKNAIRKEISDSINKYDILNRQNHASAAKDIILVSNSVKESIAESKEGISNLESEISEFKEIMENILRHLENLDLEKEKEESLHVEKDHTVKEIEKIKLLYGGIVGIFLSFGFLIMFLPLLKHI